MFLCFTTASSFMLVLGLVTCSLCLVYFVVVVCYQCLERLVSEMSYYVSSGTLNPTHSLSLLTSNGGSRSIGIL